MRSQTGQGALRHILGICLRPGLYRFFLVSKLLLESILSILVVAHSYGGVRRDPRKLTNHGDYRLAVRCNLETGTAMRRGCPCRTRERGSVYPRWQSIGSKGARPPA
jgi:hypothetical protein